MATASGQDFKFLAERTEGPSRRHAQKEGSCRVILIKTKERKCRATPAKAGAGGGRQGATCQFLPALLLVRDVRLFISTGKNEAVL